MNKKPKPNLCKSEFSCCDSDKKCVHYKKHDDFNECKYYTLKTCHSKVAQVQAAICFLKKQLGDKNITKYIMDELGVIDKIKKLLSRPNGWEYIDGHNSAICDVLKILNGREQNE